GTLPMDRAHFFRISVALILLSAVLTMFTVNAAGYPTVLRIILVLSSTLRITQVALFSLIVFLSVFYGLFWSSQSFGIALGYGLFALTQMANTLFQDWTSAGGRQVYIYVSVLGYVCAVLIWIAYALRGDKEARFASVPDNHA